MASLTTLGNRNFTMDDMQYSHLAPRYFEGWITEQLKGLVIALTHELPYSYYSNRRDGEWVDRGNIAEQASHTLGAIADIAELPNSERITMEEPRRARGFKKGSQGETIDFGGHHLIAKNAGAKVTYCGELERGSYIIYMCRAGKWQKIGRHLQRTSGRCDYKYRATVAGEVIDRIVFVKTKGWVE